MEDLVYEEFLDNETDFTESDLTYLGIWLELGERYYEGEISLEDAELMNESAYNKYIVESRWKPWDYDSKDNENDKFFVTGKDFKRVADTVYKIPPVKLGLKGVSKVTGAYTKGLEKGGQAVAKKVIRKPSVNAGENEIKEYNKKIKKAGKATKIAGYGGTFAALYAGTPIAIALKNAGAIAASNALTPTIHTGMEYYATQDEDVKKAAKEIKEDGLYLKGKLRELWDKSQGKTIDPKYRREFQKIDADGAVLAKKAEALLNKVKRTKSKPVPTPKLQETKKSKMPKVNKMVSVKELAYNAGQIYGDNYYECALYMIENTDCDDTKSLDLISQFIEEYV